MSNPENGAPGGAPLTRRQLRELAAAQEAARAAQEAASRAAQPQVSPPSPGPDQSGRANPNTSALDALPMPAPSRTPPLSRRELRERAAAARAEQEARDAASGQTSPAAPVVNPPAVTGAIRALDETGQLTPVRPVVTARPSGPPAEPAEPVRVTVRDSIAQVQAGAPARAYPRGTTPQPAAPTPQRTPLSSAVSGAGTAVPSVSPASPVAAGAQASPTGLPAPGGPAWLPIDPTGAASGPAQPGQAQAGQAQAGQAQAGQAQAGQAQAAAPRPVPAPGWARPGATDDTVAVPQLDEDFEPPVPQWGAVLPTGAASVGAEDSEQDVQDADEGHDRSGWFGYTPLQYLLWVVIGLVLGVVIWQLIDRADDSPQGTGALTSVSSEYHQAAAPGP